MGEKERTEMANEIQEMRRTMEQSMTSRPDSADYQGNQENPRTLGSQNENLGASGTSSLPGASGTQNETPRCRSLPETENVTPQNTGAIARTPNVVPITDQNRHLVRDDLGGMMIQADGTLRFTQQFLTQQQNPHIQRMKRHTITPTQTPACI